MRTLLLLWSVLTLAVCARLMLVCARNAEAISHSRARLEIAAQSAAAEEANTAQLLATTQTQLQSTLAKLDAAKALFTIHSSEISRPSGLTTAQRKRVTQHPGYTPFQARQTRRHIEQRYGEFIRTNNVSAEKAGQLRALIAETMTTTRDAQELIEAQGLDPNKMPAVRAIIRAKAEVEDDIFALLGPQLFHRYRYATSDLRQIDFFLRPFQARLADRGVPPLDAAQHAALSTAYREAAHPHVPGKERNLVLGSEYGPDRYGPSLDAKIEQLASPILSPEQFAALSSHHRDSRAQSEIMSRVREMVYPADHPHPHN